MNAVRLPKCFVLIRTVSCTKKSCRRSSGGGSPGVIYTRETDPDTDVVIVVRYERQR